MKTVFQRMASLLVVVVLAACTDSQSTLSFIQTVVPTIRAATPMPNMASADTEATQTPAPTLTPAAPALMPAEEAYLNAFHQYSVDHKDTEW